MKKLILVVLLLSGCSGPLDQRCENGLLYERYGSSGPYVAANDMGGQIKCVN